MSKAFYKISFTSLLMLITIISGNAFALSGQSGAQMTRSISQYGHSIARPEASLWLPQQLVQNDKRSRSDVMNEVKKRYDAKVLKISLNAKTQTYNVRILLPSGKVRNIQMSANR